jgi:DnaJ-class molecular chaperone
MAQDQSGNDQNMAAQTNPGDEAAPGTPSTGEGLCPECGGSGRLNDQPCQNCGGTGKIIQGISGG